MKYFGYVAQITDRDFAFVFSREVNKRFFHLTNWKGTNPPVVGDEVEFELGTAYKPGLPDQAINVTPTGRRFKTQLSVRTPSPTRIEVKTTIDGVETTSVGG